MENNEKPKSFWSHPIGKKLSYAIHEQNSGAGIIGGALLRIKHDFQKGELTAEKLDIYIARAKDGVQQQKNGMDYAYEHIKKELGYVDGNS
jgi:hypothetical protein